VSGVLGAMGVGADRARGAVRLSLGEPTIDDDISQAADALVAAWRALVRGR
jgi:cysteine sulfinate desulfinase/cysteine desulfurase-like protein